MEQPMYMTHILGKCGSSVIYAALAFWSQCAVGQELWVPAGWSGKLNLPAQAAPGRPVRFVRFDLSRLSSHETAQIPFPLPNGSSILLERAEARRSSVGGLVWSGNVQGDDRSIATLSVLNDTLVGDVVVSGLEMYRIEQVGAGTQAVFELGQNRFRHESEPLVVKGPGTSTTVSPIEKRCDEKIVEMLVVFTQAACKDAFIGDESMVCTDADKNIIRNRIQQAEAETNAIFQNSLTSPRVSIVHVALAEDYLEADSVYKNLIALVPDLNPVEVPAGFEASLQPVHDLRNQYRADVVTMITRPTNAYPQGAPCGMSVLMSAKAAWFEKYAFTIVSFDCITSNFSFAHELGHVMGARHEVSFVNAYPLGNIRPWRTVMAENDHDCANADSVNGCKRLPFFSNPDSKLNYGGDPMGTNDDNNSGVVSNTVDIVSQYRPSRNCNNE
jgi:hypothetical protein